MAIRRFALYFGCLNLILGLLPLLPLVLAAAPPDAPPIRVTAFYGYLAGLFATNVLHDAMHLAIGLAGVLAWRRFDRARAYARMVATAFLVLALMGLVPGLQTVFGLLPLHGHDVWLHLAAALAAAYFGWFVRPQDTRPTPIG